MLPLPTLSNDNNNGVPVLSVHGTTDHPALVTVDAIDATQTPKQNAGKGSTILRCYLNTSADANSNEHFALTTPTSTNNRANNSHAVEQITRS